MKKTDEEVDVILDKTITVFRFIAEKDVFERYYKAHLAKRLLLNRSSSDDAERGMLAKLKIECGYQFTQKLEGMFHDMKLSVEIQTAYKEYLTRVTVCDNNRKDVWFLNYLLATFHRTISNSHDLDILANESPSGDLYICSGDGSGMPILRKLLPSATFWS